MIVDKNNLTPGFYVATGGEEEPLYFRVVDNGRFGLSIWGFSVYKRVPGYRTLGIDAHTWVSRDYNANIEIKVDQDRLLNHSWKELDQFKPKKKNHIWTCTLDNRYKGSASGVAVIQAPTCLEAVKALRSYLELDERVLSEGSMFTETRIKECMKDVGFAYSPGVAVLALGAI